MSKLEMRAVPEWVGATPDSAIPKAVKVRIWLREEGRCYLTGRVIRAGDTFEYEHVKPIWLGGENRESNIRLALKDAHKEKSSAERSAKAKTDRLMLKHTGQWPASKTPLRSRPFPKSRGSEAQVRERRS